MPTLEWIGKDKVINHHLDVPYRVLERKYSYDENGQHEEDNGSENMIIHGDNLDALKALLPRYEGRVKCIYIDPPYNTAHSTSNNRRWVYSDNVDSPEIKKWIGEVVGDEEEDLSRHDKWLCMMYPRLKLLQRLLSNDGVIFISIDDCEYANLKNICDEIFGITCFVSNISWQRTYSTRNDSGGIVNEVEHILCYSKSPKWQPKKFPRTAKMDSLYKTPDGDPKPWASDNPFAPGAPTHQGMVYAIQHPFSGELIYPPNGRCWTFGQDQMLEYMNAWGDYVLRDLHDEEKRASLCGITLQEIRPAVPALMLNASIEDARARAEEVLAHGTWPKFYFTKNGKGGIRRKTYLEAVEGKPPTNLWLYTDAGHTDEATKQLKAIFDEKSPFETPKPSRLIDRIIQIATDANSIVLDSFAGSGTTAHAVLNMNKSDGGKRKFILIEMMEYADSITAERTKRVISGYKADQEITLFDEEITLDNLASGEELLNEAKRIAKEAKGQFSSVKKPKIEDGHLKVVAVNKAKDQVAGLGGNFSYYELGDPLMHGDMLNEDVGVEKIREYVYFTETKRRLAEPHSDEPYYMGVHVNSAYYFYYEKDTVTTLNREFLHTIKTKADAYVIYADLCTFSNAELEKYHITFKKIPRDITKL